MSGLFLPLGVGLAFVTVSILPMAGASCRLAEPIPQAEPTAQMTATEVCQYVNEWLPNEYEYQTPTLRYEFRYTAVSAEYMGQGYSSRLFPEDELTRSIKELSPRQLQLYKQELRQKFKDLVPQDRDAMLFRMRNIPGLRDLAAEFGGTYRIIGESIWQVTVNVREEYQWLREGQWIPYRGEIPRSYTMQYLLDEATGEVTRM